MSWREGRHCAGQPPGESVPAAACHVRPGHGAQAAPPQRCPARCAGWVAFAHMPGPGAAAQQQPLTVPGTVPVTLQTRIRSFSLAEQSWACHLLMSICTAGNAQQCGVLRGRRMVRAGKDAQQNGSIAGESPPDAGPPAPGTLPMPSFIRVSFPFSSSLQRRALSTCLVQLPLEGTPDGVSSECLSGWAANGIFRYVLS